MDINVSSQPDLSQLSDAERNIILNVLQRQQEDDSNNKKVLRSKQEEGIQEFSPISTTIERTLMIKSPESISLQGQQKNYGEICKICQITKFADNAGKTCYKCLQKACSRCAFNVEFKKDSIKTVKWYCVKCDQKKAESSSKQPRSVRGGSIDLTDLDIGIPSPTVITNAEVELKFRQNRDRDLIRQKITTDRKTSCPIEVTIMEDRYNQIFDTCSYSQKNSYNCSEIGDKLIYSQAQFYCGTDTPLPEKQGKSHFKYISTSMENSRSPVFVDSGFMYDDQDHNRTDYSLYQETTAPFHMANSKHMNPQESVAKYNYSRGPTVSPTTNILVNSKEIPSNEFDSENIPYFKSRKEKMVCRRKLEALWRNDSLSSDPSESQSRRLISPTKLHSYYGSRKLKQNSFSSSEDDLPTSIECTSGDDKELEIDSLSERDINPTNQWLDPSTRKSSRLGQNRSFDKDSGISEGQHREYSSEIVSQLQYSSYVPGYDEGINPVTWKPAKDGRRLIGHMILRKFHSDNQCGDVNSGILGLKVVGGNLGITGQRRAYITKVKRDSIADIVGHLLPGDEVIEWNGKSFRGLTDEDVNEIISESKHESTVELIVQRNLDCINDELNNPETVCLSGYTYFSELNNKYVMTNQSNSVRSTVATIQIRFFYNPMELEFIINLLSAANLLSPHSSKICSCFVTLTLDRERRESKIISNTNNPFWDQDLVFKDISDKYLKSRDLLITIFDYDHLYNRLTPIAEVIIELCKADLSNRLYSYPLSLYYDRREKDIDTPTPIHRSSTDTSSLSNSPYNTTKSVISPPPIPERRRNSKINLQSKCNSDFERTYNVQMDYDSKSNTRDFYNYRQESISPIIPSPDLVIEENRNQKSSGYNVQRRKSSAQLYQSSTNNCFEFQSTGKYRRNSHGRQLISGLQRSSSQRRDSVESDRVHRTTSHCIPPDFHQQDDRIYQQMYRDSTTNSSRNVEKKRKHKSRQGSLNPSEHSERIISPRELSNESIGKCESVSKEESGTHHNDSKVSELELLHTIQLSDHDDGPQRLPTTEHDANRKRRPSIGQKFSSVLRFSKKSNSTSNLEKKTRTSFQRSEEVIPAHMKMSTVHMGGVIIEKKCETAPIIDSNNPVQFELYDSSSVDAKGNVSGHQIKETTPITKSSNNQKPASLNDNQVGVFVEGLGPGQLVGRQVLGMPSMGELQLSFIDRKGKLDIEIIRARNLTPKSNCKSLPQPYVKVCLMEGKNIIEKQKTPISQRRTLDPLFQQQISFVADYSGRILQATVWGEYSRMDKKSFMGRCEVLLEDLDFSSIVFGWYKLYSAIASELPHPVVQARRLSTSSIGK